jgi:hypothetical protein
MPTTRNLHRERRIEELTENLLKMGHRRRKGDGAAAEAIMHELGLLMAIEAMEQMKSSRPPSAALAPPLKH